MNEGRGRRGGSDKVTASAGYGVPLPALGRDEDAVWLERSARPPMAWEVPEETALQGAARTRATEVGRTAEPAAALRAGAVAATAAPVDGATHLTGATWRQLCLFSMRPRHPKKQKRGCGLAS